MSQPNERTILRSENMSEWISVVKKYPARYEKVLGYVQKLGMSPYCTTVAFMDLSDKYFVDSYGNEVHSVSHWMPLPNPPEQQEERTLDNCSLFNNPWSKPKQYDGKCEGYSNKYDDEPCKQCKECKLNVFYEE